MTRPDLVVHVGLGASSTLLASALELLGQPLTRQGVRIAAPGSVGSVGGGPVLVIAPAPDVPADPSDAWAFCSLRSEQVASVIERCGARRTRILLCPERQDRLIERSFRDAVADGYSGQVGKRYPRRVEPLLDYRPVARELRALRGVLDLRILPLELVAAGQITYVNAMLGALELAQPVDLGPLSTWRIPREYGPRAVRMAVAMAPHLDTDDERARVRKYLLDTFSVPVGASPQMMPAERRSEIVIAYRGANKQFFAEFAPEFAVSSYSGRGGLDALGSMLTPVDLRRVSRAGAPVGLRAAGSRAVRSRLGRLRRRLGR